ncbi:GDYXXLXY domain-containing protein [Archangium violaceum]|uniref:GDYXXLXY domain-containing protein n=1 Tax=Archangium violaceum TaxID=83451 RepID=UPI00193B76BC|nr:GDYXXLXY domain-containing protein [Archangium violaceum]QRK13827.1 GDYXXLXY domain-containing protein [Archangium violaceum]
MMRARVIFGGLALIVLVLVVLVVRKELVLAHGTPVLLELAPVDPRSLMQGDYMVLDYAISREVRDPDPFADSDPNTEDGRLVLRLDENGVGRFVRRDAPGTPLAPGELLLRYRVRKGRVRLGAESFFFQEGHADQYADAKYGELRVADDGSSVLVGLRDAERQPLGAQSR